MLYISLECFCFSGCRWAFAAHMGLLAWKVSAVCGTCMIERHLSACPVLSERLCAFITGVKLMSSRAGWLWSHSEWRQLRWSELKNLLSSIPGTGQDERKKQSLATGLSEFQGRQPHPVILELERNCQGPEGPVWEEMAVSVKNLAHIWIWGLQYPYKYLGKDAVPVVPALGTELKRQTGEYLECAGQSV